VFLDVSTAIPVSAFVLSIPKDRNMIGKDTLAGGIRPELVANFHSLNCQGKRKRNKRIVN
jgi:hypothetical protein